MFLCLEDKLTWIFKAFDKDGGGTIDLEEIRSGGEERLGEEDCPGTLCWISSGWRRLRRMRISSWLVSRISGTKDSWEDYNDVEASDDRKDDDDDDVEDTDNGDDVDTRKAVDSSGDGDISEEDFVKNALKSRFMKKMLDN